MDGLSETSPEGAFSGHPRVLHVCDFHLKYAAGLARGTAEQGCRVGLLTRAHDLEFGGAPGAMRAFVERLSDGLVEHYVLPGRVRDPSQVRPLARLGRTLRAFRPDVIHFQEGATNDVRLLVAAGVPMGDYALTVHDAGAHPGDDWSRPKQLARFAIRRAAGVIFVHSGVVAEQLRRTRGGLPPIEIVPHGVAAPNVMPLPARPSLLFFGRISTYYKGLDVLLDAMPLVWDRVPEATLTIAGSGDVGTHPALADSRVLLRNEHVPDEQVPELFAAATCCVLPYREASQSGVGSQAKSFGRPIVATQVGGLPELVSADSGRLVPPGDAPALAGAITEVLSSPGLAEAMSSASAAWVGEAGWGAVGQMTLAAYRRHLRALA